MQHLISTLAIFFCYTIAGFCLWAIGSALVVMPVEALLLFPFGLRMGILLQTPPRYWPGIVAGDVALQLFLANQLGMGDWLGATLLGLLSCLVLAWGAGAWLRHQQSQGAEWRWPLQQGGVVALAALLQALLWSLVCDAMPGPALLLGLCGGLTVAPTCLLIWHYLAQQSWLPLMPGILHRPVNLRLRHIGAYLLLFALSLWLQHLAQHAELRRFVPFCLAIPIVFMSYRYGWQGALLATLLNGVVLIATEPQGVAPHRDLLLSLLAQSLTGMLLGAGIERQRDLNRQLSQRLEENRSLARSLVMAQETTRREIARELHDEVGQTITVIRTQAGIIRRLSDEPRLLASAEAIENYALRVYDGVHELLAQLWPASLSNLPLAAALAALLRDLLPPDQGITTRLDWRIDESVLDDTLKITLYRLCQEGVTNACRHAHPSHIEVHGWQDAAGLLHVTICDDGCGIDLVNLTPGYGLRGLRERICAMGGELQLESAQGTRLAVILPAVLSAECAN
ncbi:MULTISPECIES: signal transduction histidine-protein kinase/phosphatase UhpB [Edwardsiella]|nr:signal transduction histidine-protein kinase/phosphatase UhpB [Edwardsiella tarda]UBU95237.1 signal transduction histidine-protein kinase/phosphatase UhpB [Edwardsiella tarda]UCQ11454.1 signal transduction histidine-protein kinase/phosphatase UhpB [Edwardsiella tarda]UCQ27827.1 signal transduction histidine-protein kinase/phosphatase UhpB [Edwardsiella tarda]WGE29175.1 signal transduction histidine-protein kinase/phosphatase UhpB [Edwardsiella tarda]